MDQERILAAVLLADVVGSTPLYERIGDDAALQQISDCLDAIREIAVRHGGDFIHSKGDDVLSLFERPEAALRAVRQISSQLTKGSLTTRIGLHFGAVIRTRGEVFGDVVNVTARLSTTANPGEVLISQSFFEALSSGTAVPCGLSTKCPSRGRKSPSTSIPWVATMGPSLRRSPAGAPLSIGGSPRQGTSIWSSAMEISCDLAATTNS